MPSIPTIFTTDPNQSLGKFRFAYVYEDKLQPFECDDEDCSFRDGWAAIYDAETGEWTEL